MQPYENMSWKPYKTCLKGDLGRPSKTQKGQVGQGELKWDLT